VFSPKVLLLDEPMGALDKKLRHDLQLQLRQLHRRLGRTFINVTHDQEEAMAMSDRIAIMRAGKIVQLGSPRALYDAPSTRFVADFLGKSNFIEGKVVSVEAGIATVDTADGPVLHRPGDHDVAEGQAVILAVRPQKLQLGAGPNGRSATVETAIFLGTHAELSLRCNSGLLLTANVPIRTAEELPSEGAQIQIFWDPTSTVVVRPD
jgi:ABC-type Fe3+/spermidine/putrescine transport system ATPase subunit